MLSLNFHDVSQLNATITLGEYWGYVQSLGPDLRLVKFVTDDVIQEYDRSDSNSTSKILYKTFYTEDDVNHNVPLYVIVLRSRVYNSGSWRDGNEVIYYSHEPMLYQNLDSYSEAGFVFRLTAEDSDLFNPPTIEDIDPDWPNSGGDSAEE